jgi:hypothetical protein
MSCCEGNLDSSQEKYIRKDGKIDFIASQSMGGNRLTNLANALNDGDAVNYGQLTEAITQVNGIGNTYTTAVPIDSLTVVSVGLDGLIYPADGSDQSIMNTIVGISTETKVENSTMRVIQFGTLSNLTDLITGTPYYFDETGTLTVSAPSTGFTQIIGLAKSPTELLVDLETPIAI